MLENLDTLFESIAGLWVFWLLLGIAAFVANIIVALIGAVSQQQEQKKRIEAMKKVEGFSPESMRQEQKKRIEGYKKSRPYRIILMIALSGVFAFCGSMLLISVLYEILG